MFRSMLFLAPFAVIGCATPTSGDYLFEYGDVTTDCPEVEDTGGAEVENEPVGIKVADDGATVTIGGADCPLDGNTFTCDTSSETDYTEFGMDAIGGFSSSLVGTWVSSSKITGTSDVALTCDGADCATAGITACSASGEYEAALQE